MSEARARVLSAGASGGAVQAPFQGWRVSPTHYREDSVQLTTQIKNKKEINKKHKQMRSEPQLCHLLCDLDLSGLQFPHL